MENYDQLLVYLCTRLEHFDNDCVTFLRKHSKKYVETEQEMNEILEHTAIKNFLINEDSIYLTEQIIYKVYGIRKLPVHFRKCSHLFARLS